MQRILPAKCSQEARLQLQVLALLHRGQGQEEPVQVLQTEEVLQGGDEEGRGAE